MLPIVDGECTCFAQRNDEGDMLDSRVREHIDPILDAIGHALDDRGITPNVVTLAGFGIGCVAALAIALGALWTGLVLLLISRICDGLDGSVARAGGKQSDLGGYLDIVLDFAFYGLIPLAFIFYDPGANTFAGSVLLLTFYINGASFLAYAMIAEKRGLDESERGSKSMLYTTGLAEATETISVFVLFCLFPTWFSAIAWLFAAIVAYTTFSRMMLAWETFGDV